MGVPQNATQEEIKKHYYHLCNDYRPDLNPTAETRAFTAAYELLSDPEKRKRFDEYGTNKDPYEEAMVLIIHAFGMVSDDYHTYLSKGLGSNRHASLHPSNQSTYVKEVVQRLHDLENAAQRDIYVCDSNIQAYLLESSHGLGIKFEKHQELTARIVGGYTSRRAAESIKLKALKFNKFVIETAIKIMESANIPPDTLDMRAPMERRYDHMRRQPGPATYSDYVNRPWNPGMPSIGPDADPGHVNDKRRPELQ